MTEREFRIGIFGTFDVENYGDLLFPLIAEAELSRRLGPIKLQRFSYHRKTNTDWPYEVIPLSELPNLVGRLDGALIGGGHMLRFDKGSAKDYCPPTSVHHPAGYWLSPALIALNNGLPVAWNAPGGNGLVPPWAESLVTIAIRGSSYVCVRDEQLRPMLERFADGKEIRVVPDTAFGVARLVDRCAPSPDYVRLRGELGLSKPYIIVQATKDLLPAVRFLKSQQQLLDDYRVLVLSTGPINGDDDEIFGDKLPSAVRLPTWPKPLLVAELIAGASFVIGVSLHLSISAVAFGVPVFRPARLFGEKYVILKGLDGVFPFDDSGAIEPEQFDSITARTEQSASMASILRKLEEHWDRVASVFAGETKSSCVCNVSNEFWQSIPSLLETRAEAISELAARNQKVADMRNSTSWKLTAPVRYLADRRRRNSGAVLNTSRMAQAVLLTQPYEWAFIDRLFAPADARALMQTFPRDHFKTIKGYDGEKGYQYEARALIGMGAQAASHTKSLSSTWRRLADDLLSPSYRAAIANLVKRDLTFAPMEVNVFHYGPGAWLGPHVDLEDKIVSHIFYFNESWNEEDGGSLSILRSPTPADAVANILPIIGNSAVIVRSNSSWHAVPPVSRACKRSRRSMTITFYRSGSVSTMWPPGDKTSLHDYDDSRNGLRAEGKAGQWPKLIPRFLRS